MEELCTITGRGRHGASDPPLGNLRRTWGRNKRVRSKQSALQKRAVLPRAEKRGSVGKHVLIHDTGSRCNAPTLMHSGTTARGPCKCLEHEHADLLTASWAADIPSP